MTALLDRLQALADALTPDPEGDNFRTLDSREFAFYAACREAVPLLIQACRAAVEVVAHGTPGPGESYLTPDACCDALRAALAPLTGSGDSE